MHVHSLLCLDLVDFELKVLLISDGILLAVVRIGSWPVALVCERLCLDVVMLDNLVPLDFAIGNLL